jgi:hypothetical protein
MFVDVDASTKVIVDDVIVLASIDSLNVTEIELFVGTPAEPFAGETETTVGGVVSGAPLVVKLEVNAFASAFPAASFTPVDTVTEYEVPNDKADDGVSVAVFVAAL